MGVVKAPMCTTLPKRIYRTIMKPRINIITVGVDNLEKSLAFYREGLGLPSKGIVATEFHDEISGADGAIAIFELQNGLILSLYPRTELAKDANQKMGVESPTEFSLGYLASGVDHSVGHSWPLSMMAELFRISFFPPCMIVARFPHISRVLHRW